MWKINKITIVIFLLIIIGNFILLIDLLLDPKKDFFIISMIVISTIGLSVSLYQRIKFNTQIKSKNRGLK